MAEARNLKYPNISLSEAIAKAKSIYSSEHMVAMTPTVAAEAMGYKGISGASLKAISSLKKYGLLEGRNDQVRLTKDAQVIAIDDPSSSDFQQAIARTALKPDIFLEVHKQFSAGGSERNIAVYLEKQGLKPEAASNVAKNYKEAVAMLSGSLAAVALSTVDDEVDEFADFEEETSSARVAAAMPVRRRLFPTSVIKGGTPTTTAGAVSMGRSTAPNEPVGSANAPFRITMDGNKLHIVADVDLKGLQMLKQVLEKYEGMLELLAPNEEDGLAQQ